MQRALLVVSLLALPLAPAWTQPRIIGGCPILPGNSFWYSRVDNLPVSAYSATWVNSIGPTANLFPDFWSNAGGLFLNIAPASTPRVPVTVQYAGEADPGPYPIPSNALVQGASDAHLLVLDQGNCKLYEMWSAAPQADGSWSVGSAATFDLSSNVERPPNWTAANAAGMAFLPGVVTYDEVMSGQINHAIGMTVPQSPNAYIWPATHWASFYTATPAQFPPFGSRFRLKAGFDVSPYPFEVQVILNALKKYGAIVDDNGAPWFLNGLQDPRWNDNNLHTITQVLGSNMEAVDTSSLMVSANSGVVAGSPLALDSIYLDQRQVSAGTVVNGQAILTAPAPAGGTQVTLTTSNPAAVSAPASVSVAPGATSASFTATVQSIAVTTPVVITGSYNGVSSRSPQLLVSGTTGAAAPLLSALSVSPSSTASGTGVTATITLTAAAPAGGTVVNLSSGNPGIVQVPATVTVPSGASAVNVPLTTAPQGSAVTVNVSASLLTDSLTTPLSLTASSGGTPPPPPPSSGGSTIQINAGGPAYTDPSGNQWTADSSYTGGYTWSTTANIAGTNTPTLYQTCRYGTFNYQLSVPNGSYNVILKFAEIALGGPGQRQFNVAINGSPVLSNFDIFAQAGGENVALDKTFPVTVSNGQVVIAFTAGPADLPLISAIQVAPLSSSAFAAIRVNASGPAYTDPSGNVWSADTGFTGGNLWTSGSWISGTSTPVLYQTCRWGAFSYNFAVPNGSHTVTLKFAEVTLDGPRLRQFNVAINGSPVLSNFDIFAQAGGWLTAIDKSFPVNVTNGQISIQFTPGAADWPLVSAIQIQ